MDESYLAWLRLIPGVTPELAKRIAERYPDAELLKGAGPKDLTAVPGVSEEIAGRVLELVRTATRSDEAWYKDEPGLYLCPECGSFVGKGAGACPFCGVVFEEGGAADEGGATPPVEDLLRSERGETKICTKCGAFIGPGETACAMCGTLYPVERLAELPAVDTRPVQDVDVYLCPHCGAFLAEGAGSCAICGRPVVAEERLPGLTGKGMGKDFLTRWQKAAEPEPPREKGLPLSLAEELDRCDRLLETDPSSERAWVRKGRILIELGRAAEAVESFDRAAQLNPERDEAYKLEVLSALGPTDWSALPPRWAGEVGHAAPAEATAEAPPRRAAPEARALSEEGTAALRRALVHYDRLLETDGGMRAAWLTKAELLERLGRADEARTAFRRAAELEVAERELGRAALVGLQTLAPGRARPRRAASMTGRTNGRVNGLTNGRRGRTNGLTNGLTNGMRGRTNGLVGGVGAVNGVAGGAGRVNGIVNGLVTGRGRTNGLINGDGFTNGRRGGLPRRIVSPERAWARSVGVAAVLLVMIAAPILVSLLTEVPAPTGIKIDGAFQDWSGVAPEYFNAPGHDTVNPDVNVVGYKVHVGDDGLDAFVHVEGTAFGGANGGADALVAFLDTDNNTKTGYDAGRLGADYMVKIVGWDGHVNDSHLFQFSPLADRKDWYGFQGIDSVPAACKGHDIEFSVTLGRPASARVLVSMIDGLGRLDVSDAVVVPASPALVVREATIAPDVIASASGVGILRVGITAAGLAAKPSALGIVTRGSLADSAVSLTLFRDTNGDGVLDAGDAQAGTSAVAQGRASFPLSGDIPANSTITYFVSADFAQLPRNETFGLAVAGVTSDGAVSIASRDLRVSYLAGAPAPTVDGAFADWSGVPKSADPAGDVTDRGNASVPMNRNVDLTEVASSLAANASFYFRVDGTMMGGVDVPNVQERLRPPGPPAPPGPNVTLRLVGVDSAIAYIDGDNSSATGAPYTVSNTTYGLDWAIVVMGRHGAVTSSGLYRYNRTGGNATWDFVQDVPAAVDSTRLEAAAPDSVLRLVPGYRTVYYASDWRLSYDVAIPLPPGRSAPGPGTRSPAGDNVVINEVWPQPNPEALEIANPTSSAISLSGWTLQRFKGSKWETFYTYGSVTIGAWGSGSQYLTIDPVANSLPNGQETIRIADSAGNEVDRTTYRGTSSGTSWSRFKDPYTGKPMDSDNDAADFYVSSTPTRNAANDRNRPTIVVAKTANKATVTPGDTITYTVYYNNTDTGRANTVWVNDTLPTYVTFLSSSVAPVGSTGQTYRWQFANIDPSTNRQFTVTVRVNIDAPNGASLVNRAALNYTDQLGKRLETSNAWRNVTVWRPMIKVVKIGDKTVAVPGDTIVYTIYYNNTGFATAAHVWINDTLPQDVTYQSSSVPPVGSWGQTYYWHFTNVGIGAHSFTITVKVNLNPTSSKLVNWVFLNYTTAGGYKLEESKSSWTTSIPEFSDLALVAIVPLILLGVRRMRRRRER